MACRFVDLGKNQVREHSGQSRFHSGSIFIFHDVFTALCSQVLYRQRAFPAHGSSARDRQLALVGVQSRALHDAAQILKPEANTRLKPYSATNESFWKIH